MFDNMIEERRRKAELAKKIRQYDATHAPPPSLTASSSAGESPTRTPLFEEFAALLSSCVKPNQIESFDALLS